MYQQQIGDGFWLAERYWNGKAVKSGRRIENKKRESVGDETGRCEDRQKLRHPFWVSCAKGSYTRCEAVKTELAGEYVRVLQQKTRRIISQSVSTLSLSLSLSLSPHDVLFLSVYLKRFAAPLILDSLSLLPKAAVIPYLELRVFFAHVKWRQKRIEKMSTFETKKNVISEFPFVRQPVVNLTGINLRVELVCRFSLLHCGQSK